MEKVVIKGTSSGVLSFIKPFIKEGKKPAVFTQTVDIYNHLRFHIDGYKYVKGSVENPYFDVLVTKRRPGESDDIINYRKENYLPKTKQPCFKVLNSFKKIVKSQDWKIDYSKSEKPNVTGDETLERYCEKDYPFYKSLENWLYTIATKQVITDPNGLFYVEPMNWGIDDGEKYEPVVKFCKTPNIYAYKYGEYALFLSDHVHTVGEGDTKRDLPVYIFMTPTIFAYVKEINIERDMSVEIMSNTMEELYCFKAGGELKDIVKGEAIYNSFIDPMLSSLDAIVGESSDLQAEVVQHIYSTMWYYSGNDCRNCKGTGSAVVQGEKTACPRCKGDGRMLHSPYKDMVIGKDALGEGGVPTPPAGYVTKSTEIVSIQDTRIKNHEFDALSSLNMEFLAQTPLNQSGVGKEVDRDELNNFVYGVAYHLVQNVLKRSYRLINDLRYSVLIKDAAKRHAMEPSIAVPEKYDLLSTNTLLDNFKKAVDSGIDNSIKDEYEVDIINKLFNNQPEVRDKLLLVKELDPLRGHSEEDKLQLFNSNIVTSEDYIISTYITVFVDELVDKDEKFLELDQDKQMIEVRKLAKTKETDLAKQMADSIVPPIPPTPPTEDE